MCLNLLVNISADGQYVIRNIYSVNRQQLFKLLCIRADPAKTSNPVIVYEALYNISLGGADMMDALVAQNVHIRIGEYAVSFDHDTAYIALRLMRRLLNRGNEIAKTRCECLEIDFFAKAEGNEEISELNNYENNSFQDDKSPSDIYYYNPVLSDLNKFDLIQNILQLKNNHGSQVQQLVDMLESKYFQYVSNDLAFSEDNSDADEYCLNDENSDDNSNEENNVEKKPYSLHEQMKSITAAQKYFDNSSSVIDTKNNLESENPFEEFASSSDKNLLNYSSSSSSSFSSSSSSSFTT